MKESVKVVRVIKTIKKVGDGTEKNPVRTVIQYWSLNGKLLITMDDHPLTNEQASSDVRS